MHLIQKLDQLLGDVQGFPRQWTSTYHGVPVMLSGLSDDSANDRDAWLLIYPIDDEPFDRRKYQKVMLFDPELDHMFRDFQQQMHTYLETRRTRPLSGEEHHYGA